jgi:hypothetical protein
LTRDKFGIILKEIKVINVSKCIFPEGKEFNSPLG